MSDCCAEVERLSNLIAACPQGIEGHACCDCPTLYEAELERRLSKLEKAQPIVRLR
jgi:hypothetical protein